MKNKNVVWSFFASVKLALFTLGSLAVTSILGTIIPQKEATDFYVGKYGAATAQFFQLFDIPDMYTSWWFLTLLGLLSLNLIICSIDRFPGVWKQIKADNLAVSLERLEKMGMKQQFPSTHSAEETVQRMEQSLTKQGWKPASLDRDGATLLFSQKGAWSRTGVYLVHTSILVIFLGAIYGYFTGFKGSIMLPELQSSKIIYPFEGKDPIDLGFEVRCDRFDIGFYQNGMPKLFRSDLVVLEDGVEVKRQAIEVNDPLVYKGITFYQSSYQAYRNFVININDENGGDKNFMAAFQNEVKWPEKKLSFGVINIEGNQDRAIRLKIWFADNNGVPSEFWMNAGEQVKLKRPDTTYVFSAKQRYATGLQVAKDPGVWIVYLGCGIMLFGLYLAFFMSHQRIWVLLKKDAGNSTVLVSGTSNKNKVGFEKSFNDLAESLREQL